MFSAIISVWIVLLACGLQHVSCDVGSFERRRLSSNTFYNSWGAILVKDGEQTTCEIGLIGLSAGMVSANCFDFSHDTTLSPSANYEAYIYKHDLLLKPDVYTIDHGDIHIYPDFNPTTLVYNMAVVEFNKDSSSNVTTYPAMYSYNNDISAYTQRSLGVSNLKWNVPSQIEPYGDFNGICNSTDGIYKANHGSLACNNDTIVPKYGSECAIPYSAMYAEFDSKFILIALYSHSVILGTNRCSDQWINFYTYTSWYMGYAAKVLGRPLEYMYNFKLVSTSDFKESGYTLNAPTFIDMTDKMRVGGNLYAKQAAIVTSTSTTGSDKDISSATSSSNLELSATDTSINGTEEPSSSGLSKTLKIIIGAVVPAVVIIAAIIVFLVYHYLRKKQLYDKERSHAEQMHMREIANDLVVDESVQPHAILPPPYSANSDTETVTRRDSVVARPSAVDRNSASEAVANGHANDFREKR